MKFAVLAALALVSQVSAVRYAESEGPTKVDLGEDDPNVLDRADDSSDPKILSKWQKENPLTWQDGGDADETVLTMLDGSLYQSKTVLTMTDGTLRYF